MYLDVSSDGADAQNLAASVQRSAAAHSALAEIIFVAQNPERKISDDVVASCGVNGGVNGQR
jgi:hypothetical protein